MSGTVLHLRSETKPLEHRSALTPSTTKALVDAGYTVNVERSPVRIFDDEDFEKAGATLVPEGSWTGVPKEHIVVGLKELPEEDFPLKHTHVQFAHCYKNQGGWEQVLSRFPRGGGTLLDLEFLEDDSGRRVAAFGYHAGFAGAALAAEAWGYQVEHDGQEMGGVKPYNTEADMVKHVKACLEKGAAKAGRQPRAFVMGALGRCGRGAVDLFEKVGIPSDNILKWDLAETSAKEGPYQEIVDCDIFVNCIYLSKKIPPFINQTTLDSPSRKLSVICDVSCDTTNPNNPIPVYSEYTSFTKPTIPVKISNGPKLTVISIDHLPTLLPREASEAFSSALLPSLLTLSKRSETPVWQKAEKLYREKAAPWLQGNGHA